MVLLELNEEMLYTWSGISIHYLLGMAFIVVMSPNTKYKNVLLNQPPYFE